MKIKSFILLLLFSAILMIFQTFAIDVGDKLYLHYYRFDQNYTNWDVWLWQNKPTSLEGNGYSFVEDETSETYNFGGMVAIIDLSPNFLETTEFGIIIRKSDWSQKDIDADRFFTMSTASGDQHFYFVEGDPLIGTHMDDANGPTKDAKIKSANFMSLTEIHFEGTENFIPSSLNLYIDNVIFPLDANQILLNTDSKKGVIYLETEMSFDHTYKLETTFSNSITPTSITVSFNGLYNTTEFEEAFGYDGDLGAIYDRASTTFKLWAPISNKVVLNIYETGTPSSLGGSNTKITRILTKSDFGVFETTVLGDLHGKFYTYDVTNGQLTNKDIVDPYAKSVGINGLRGMVIDFSRTNPEGWSYDGLPKTITNQTDAMIYELHIRDLTTHASWNGSDINRGNYGGLIESGTTYNGLTTGFDHIKELGITHLQLLPFFDYGNAIDETRQDDSNYNSFNWGYMPLNFNALEGNYSSDPYSGIKRVEEFKEVVQTYLDNDIRINMDVVYNHTGESANSNFNLIVPGYYHRLLNNGAYSNGSGTGNETASERKMVRKFIVDSVLFWAKEYKLGGFRFDLMALHDIDTMREISAKLYEIDPTIMVYGEPWTGGTSLLSSDQQADKSNLQIIDNVGAFNDDFRDAIKGSVFSSWMKGFVQGDYSNKNRVKYGVTGGTQHQDNVGYSVWHGSPEKTINYVTAHDNNTLNDKLYLTLVDDNRLNDITKLSLQAHGLVLTSQGIPFIHAGDEFMRSKEISEGEFDHNSYQSSDEINQIQWHLKSEHLNHYNHFLNLLNIRKLHPELRYKTQADIDKNVRFLYDDTKGIISYMVKSEIDSRTLVIILNANQNRFKTKLPIGNWTILSHTTSEYTSDKEIITGTFTIDPNSFYVLETNQLLSIDAFNEPLVNSSTYLNYLYWLIPGVIVLGGITVATFFFIRKKHIVK